MSPTRQHLFLSLADRFPEPIRSRLRLGILTGEPVEFVEDRDTGKLTAEIGGCRIWTVWVQDRQPALAAR